MANRTDAQRAEIVDITDAILTLGKLKFDSVSVESLRKARLALERCVSEARGLHEARMALVRH